MAYKLIWSPLSRNDLHDIVHYVALDSPERAAAFGFRLIQRMEVLQEHPEIGRCVPEHRNPLIREIIFRPYRIVYRVNHERRTVEIASTQPGALPK